MLLWGPEICLKGTTATCSAWKRWKEWWQGMGGRRGGVPWMPSVGWVRDQAAGRKEAERRDPE